MMVKSSKTEHYSATEVLWKKESKEGERGGNPKWRKARANDLQTRHCEGRRPVAIQTIFGLPGSSGSLNDRLDCHGTIRFQGQYFDAETGLHYNTFRYYDPGCGRFISPNPITIQGLNLYQYAPNAANWIDPWG
jgi:RHS repeat-associated protein